MIIFIFLGVVASIFQLVILREFTFSIAKNELSFIIAVGLWLISGGLGSLLADKNKRYFSLIPLLTSLTFSLSIALIHLVKSFFNLKYYESVSFSFTLLCAAVFIIPMGLIIGYAFACFVQDYLTQKQGENKIYAKFFAFEAIGFFLGGLIFTFLLSNYSNPFIFTIFSLLLLAALKERYKKFLLGLVIILISVISLACFNSILKNEFDDASILQNFGSKYGPVISARKGAVVSYFAGGSLLATSEDRLMNEEFIHMSLSALPVEKQKDILFIGAGISGEIEEIAKYNLNTLDSIQINPVISSLSRKRLPEKLKTRVNFIVDDPPIYLRKANKHYDAILMSEPAPSNLALNRFFTREFFANLSSRLNKNGIFSFYIPSKREILSSQFIKFNSSIINSLQGSFKNRLLIPSDTMIVIASNGPDLRPSDLLDNYAKAHIKQEFFNLYNFRDYLDAGMRDYVEGLMDKKIEANSELNPTGFLNYLILEQIKFYPDLKIDLNSWRRISYLGVFLSVFIALFLSLLSKKSSGIINMAAVGFSAIALNSIILVLFQQYCGALFWKAGLLIGLFMLGLSLGTLALNSIISKVGFRCGLLSGLYSLWAILALSLIPIAALYSPDVVFYLYSLTCGILTGAAYPLLAQALIKNKFARERITVFIYASDLSGAFLGTLACGIILIPLLGVIKSLLIIIFLNLAFCLKNFLVS